LPVRLIRIRENGYSSSWLFIRRLVGEAGSEPEPKDAVWKFIDNLPARTGVGELRKFSTPSAQEAAQESDNFKASQEAEAVRQRHLAELMKIPHVTGIAIGTSASNVTIFIVYVDKATNVEAVERQAPSKLEGYDVDVEPEPTGNGFPAGGIQRFKGN